MTPAEPPPEPVEPAADSPSEQPVWSEQDAVFLHYRAQSRARRERRRRQLRIAVGTLVVGAGLLTAVLFWTRHQRPPIATRTIEPPAAPAPVASTAAPPAASPAPPVAEIRPVPPIAPPTPPVASTPAPVASVTDVSYQPRERLKSVHDGDTKETVFELFGTAFERRKGSLVRIEGIRLRASGRSALHAQVEVADVRISDAVAAGSLYWFLFGDGRLIAWGRAEEWPVATARHQVNIEYQPDPTPAGRRSADRP